MKNFMKRLGKSNKDKCEMEDENILTNETNDLNSEGSLDESKMLSKLESYYNGANGNYDNDRTESMYTEIGIITKYKNETTGLEDYSINEIENKNKRESSSTTNTVNIEEKIKKFDINMNGNGTLKRNRFGIINDKTKTIDNDKTKMGVDEKNQISCKICNNRHKDAFVILECNHTFHVNCLVETHFADIYNYENLNENYIDCVKCDICSKLIGSEELMFLHSKFLSNTKERLMNQQDKINILEDKLRQLKDELRLNYEHKNRLERERDVSKKVVKMVINMM
jgi:hypothetical protein